MERYIKLDTYDSQKVLVEENNLKRIVKEEFGFKDLDDFFVEYTYDDSEYFFDAGYGFKVVGYYIDKESFLKGEYNGVTIMVVIDEGNEKYTVYSPVGQHSEADRGYIHNECIEITKEQYLEADKVNYTPEDYL